MNQAFVDTPFRFTWNRTANTRVVYDNTIGSLADHQKEVSQAVGVPDLKTLNVFVGEALLELDSSGFVLGFASPAAAQREGVGE